MTPIFISYSSNDLKKVFMFVLNIKCMEEISGKVSLIDWQSETTLYLKIKMETPLEFEPGKFINLTYKGTTRSYTCCNFEPSDLLELFIRLKEGGEISEKFKTIKVGEDVLVKGLFDEVKFEGKKVMGIGGGSGMAAFISLARSIENGRDNELIFFGSSRKANEIAFPDELMKMKKVKVILSLTREEKEGFETGRINRELIEKYCNPADYSIFICGPQPFTLSLGEALKEFKPHLMMW